jgi:hypothetical protein
MVCQVGGPENWTEKSRPIRLPFSDFSRSFLNVRDKNENGRKQETKNGSQDWKRF